MGIVFKCKIQCFTNKKISYRYKGIILCLAAINLISVFPACTVYNEPLLYALEATRTMFVILLYFPLKRLFDIYGAERIIAVILRLANFVAVMLILQSLLHPNITFLYTVSGERFNRYRTYSFLPLIIFNILYYTAYAVMKKSNFKSVFWYIIDIIAFIFVQQTKSSIIAVVGAIFVTIVLNRDKDKLINKILFIVFWIGFVYLTHDYIGMFYKDMVDTIDEAAETTTGNIGIRIKLIEFILKITKDHEVLGLGYYAGKWPMSAVVTGRNRGFAMGDVGFFAYIFHVGYLGLALSVVYLLKLAKNILSISKDNVYSLFGKIVMVYFLLICVFNYYFTTSYLIIYLLIYTCIFENVLEREKKNE